MKKILLIFAIFFGLLGASCNKYLDINTNPNSASSSSPQKILPLALVNTASLMSSLNYYGSYTVGYSSNAGGYGGFGDVWTYNYSTTDGNGYWSSGYSILENLQYNIIDATMGDAGEANYDAAAKILKVYIFEALVDQFNDIPYSQALKGATYPTPKYDSASAIYQDLALTLDSAIAEINTNASNAAAIASGSDPLFGGDMTKWKQFANTLKLRLIVRASSVMSFSDATFTSDGFLTDDAIVNPGYGNSTASSGAQTNPSWSTWVVNYAGSSSLRDFIPSNYIYGYYDGHTLKDSARGAAIYYNFPNTPVSQLGATTTSSQNAPAVAGAWYHGNASTVGSGGTTLGNNIGVMKGPDMGEPLMLLAESDFLQAEADVRGILSGDAATDFDNGIKASFRYLYELPSGAIASGMDPDADAATYMANNSTSFLVNFSLATTEAEKIQAIITQKYLALNFINGFEAWNEYRRTGYPVSSSTVLNNPYGSFASLQSQATRPDQLPTRLPYPASEFSTNGNNVPPGINVFTSLIFWAK